MSKPLFCRIGLHDWCKQGGYASFYFCNLCGKVKPDA